jgi:hypothetical protein
LLSFPGLLSSVRPYHYSKPLLQAESGKRSASAAVSEFYRAALIRLASAEALVEAASGPIPLNEDEGRQFAAPRYFRWETDL